jgi:ABC-2 type transport system ATP-binding protein
MLASAGEVVGIIGPNGAGKTTLLETVLVCSRLTSGKYSGEVLSPPQRRNVLFYLPHGVCPYRDQTTSQVISFFAGVYLRSKAETASMCTRLPCAPSGFGCDRFQGSQATNYQRFSWRRAEWISI